MRLTAGACAVIVSLGVASDASAFQPVEAGLQPVHERIQNVQGEIYALAGEFSANRTTRDERDELGRRMVQLIGERKALEAEVARARALSRSPLVNFAMPSESAK